MIDFRNERQRRGEREVWQRGAEGGRGSGKGGRAEGKYVNRQSLWPVSAPLLTAPSSRIVDVCWLVCRSRHL
eukprot:685011-Prorocentrum_minimum.AAC.2